MFGQGDLWTRDGRAFARLASDRGHRRRQGLVPRWASRSSRELAGGVDAVLMRKDPPFDMEYIYSTYLLERAEQAGVLVVNRPQGLRDMNEKAYTAWFPDCCAPTLITRDMAAMEAFLDEHGQAVFKPLDGMGGRSIFVVAEGRPERARRARDADRGRRAATRSRSATCPRSPRPAMRASCSWTASPCRTRWCACRRPATIAATSRPARRAESRALTDRDRWLASRIGPVMRERGMLFVGLDVIGGFVTEINVTSPTGIREIEKKHGHDIGGMLIDAVLARLARR